jgi:hypothetical protein
MRTCLIKQSIDVIDVVLHWMVKTQKEGSQVNENVTSLVLKMIVMEEQTSDPLTIGVVPDIFN